MTLSLRTSHISRPQDVSINHKYKHWGAHVLQSSDMFSRDTSAKRSGSKRAAGRRLRGNKSQTKNQTCSNLQGLASFATILATSTWGLPTCCPNVVTRVGNGPGRAKHTEGSHDITIEKTYVYISRCLDYMFQKKTTIKHNM